MLDTGEFETVYNMRIADHHTYFVGDSTWGFAIWAHNECVVYISVVKGIVKYVGITGDIVRRSAEHARIGRVVEEIGLLGKSACTRTAIDRKVWSDQRSAGNRLGGTLENLNRGIDSRKLKDYTKELEWAQTIIKKLKL